MNFTILHLCMRCFEEIRVYASQHMCRANVNLCFTPQGVYRTNVQSSVLKREFLQFVPHVVQIALCCQNYEEVAHLAYISSCDILAVPHRLVIFHQRFLLFQERFDLAFPVFCVFVAARISLAYKWTLGPNILHGD